jgi:hypothetical protein
MYVLVCRRPSALLASLCLVVWPLVLPWACSSSLDASYCQSREDQAHQLLRWVQVLHLHTLPLRLRGRMTAMHTLHTTGSAGRVTASGPISHTYLGKYHCYRCSMVDGWNIRVGADCRPSKAAYKTGWS